MQIVFLVADIHFGGGGERVSINLANQLAENGYKVAITSISTPKSVNIFNIDAGIEVNYLGIDLDKGLNLLNKVKSIFEVRKYFKSINENSMVLGIGTYPTILAALLPKTKHIKTIGCQHCSFSSVNYGWRILSKTFFHRLDALVSLTYRDLDKLNDWNKNVRVIPNAVSFYPEDPALLKKKIILTIGRIDFDKGYDLLLDVFERFAAINKDWSLRIIGDGILKGELISRIDKSNLKEKVVILPSTDSVIDEYLNASVYMMTSRTEGLPMVLLEAQGCGLPILAFNCETGPAEIVNNNIDGYLIDCFKVDEMALKLQELCTDADKRREFGKNARENIRKFLPEKIYCKWEELFKELQLGIGN